MNWQWKLAIIAAYTAIVFGAGIQTKVWMDNTSKLKDANHRIESVNKAQNNIIQFHQDVRKANVKDSCFNAKLPVDIIKLLK